MDLAETHGRKDCRVIVQRTCPHGRGRRVHSTNFGRMRNAASSEGRGAGLLRATRNWSSAHALGPGGRRVL
eukprot:4132500-Pyramimonas_sp.AAC.1